MARQRCSPKCGAYCHMGRNFGEEEGLGDWMRSRLFIFSSQNHQIMARKQKQSWRDNCSGVALSLYVYIISHFFVFCFFFLLVFTTTFPFNYSAKPQKSVDDIDSSDRNWWSKTAKLAAHSFTTKRGPLSSRLENVIKQTREDAQIQSKGKNRKKIVWSRRSLGIDRTQSWSDRTTRRK